MNEENNKLYTDKKINENFISETNDKIKNIYKN